MAPAAQPAGLAAVLISLGLGADDRHEAYTYTRLIVVITILQTRMGQQPSCRHVHVASAAGELGTITIPDGSGPGQHCGQSMKVNKFDGLCKSGKHAGDLGQPYRTGAQFIS